MNYYVMNILVLNREIAYRSVNEILHEFAEHIRLRVGFPVMEENMAIIFVVLKTDNDTVGALSGRLGQVEGVKVKTTLIKKEG
ncbi:MAG: iron-only hydrogenase system regulator [Thermotogae bacterium]|nr:iron-only hydrogenase system regulator [Thermotogota bacterium]